MTRLALPLDAVAVVVGGASEGGFAVAMRFVRMGLRVCLADLGGDRFKRRSGSASAARAC